MSDFDPEEMLLLKDAARRNAAMIDQSVVCLSLFTPGCRHDPIVLMQLGLAVVLDKPMLLLVAKGMTVPENIRRLAYFLEEVDFDDAEARNAATLRLIDTARARGFLPEPGP